MDADVGMSERCHTVLYIDHQDAWGWQLGMGRGPASAMGFFSDRMTQPWNGRHRRMECI
jgi:hypothetical protein